MNNPPKSKWRWRILRWGLICVAVLVTLVAALVTEENWRGKREWEAYKKAAEARGEWFSLSARAITNVPDDLNFTRAPIFASIFTSQKVDSSNQAGKPNSPPAEDPLSLDPYYADASDPGGHGDWTRARLTRLEAWQNYYRHPAPQFAGAFLVAPQPQSPGADVLLALSKYDSAIEGLRDASQRPFVQFGITNVIENNGLSQMLSYLAVFKRFTQVLNLRAIAELGDNRADQGLADVQLMLKLSDKLGSQPLLIVQLVSVAINAYTLQPIYEGLVQHRWNDAQLAELENALVARDFLADYQTAMAGERAFANETEENRRITREYETIVDHTPGKSSIKMVSMRFVPSAIFYQNELALARLADQVVLPMVDVTNRLVSPAAVRQAAADGNRQLKHFSPYKIEGQMIMQPIINCAKKFAIAQSNMDLARVACALERCRLAQGGYPETLDGLAPQYIDKLPHDVINGQPLHYRRTEGGHYVLYSVGWNEKDDGGVVALNKNGVVDRDKGDWVWDSAAK